MHSPEPDDYKITVLDWRDNEIKVGSMCVYGSPTTLGDPNYLVRVAEITDLDGDVDDDTGRSVQINPFVKVVFEIDGTEEQLHTASATRPGSGRPTTYDGEFFFECSDLEVIQ